MRTALWISLFICCVALVESFPQSESDDGSELEAGRRKKGGSRRPGRRPPKKRPTRRPGINMMIKLNILIFLYFKTLAETKGVTITLILATSICPTSTFPEAAMASTSMVEAGVNILQ